MKKFFFFFAVTGWVLAINVHILSLGDIDVSEKFPFIWILHIGVFVAWIPAIISLRKNEELKKYQQKGIPSLRTQRGFFKIIFKNTPSWLTTIAVVGFFYAIINFLFFILSLPGSPAIRNNQFVLENHGQLMRVLTEQEYHHYRAKEIRGFSGHWIAFYGIAMAVLFPYKPDIRM